MLSNLKYQIKILTHIDQCFSNIKIPLKLLKYIFIIGVKSENLILRLKIIKTP